MKLKPMVQISTEHRWEIFLITMIFGMVAGFPSALYKLDPRNVDPWGHPKDASADDDHLLPKDLAVEQLQGSIYLVALANLVQRVGRCGSHTNGGWFQNPLHIPFPFLV